MRGRLAVSSVNDEFLRLAESGSDRGSTNWSGRMTADATALKTSKLGTWEQFQPRNTRLTFAPQPWQTEILT
jgi:hypothetical protein